MNVLCVGILEYLKRISVNMNFIFSFQMGGGFLTKCMYIYFFQPGLHSTSISTKL